MNITKIRQMVVGVLKTLIFPMAVFIIFVILSDGRIASWRTVVTTLRQSVMPTLICLSLVINMTVGCMNFASGGVVLCAAIVGGNLANLTGMGLFGLIFWCLLVSLALTFLTGFLYNKMRVPALVLTIGLVFVFEAIPRVLFNGGVVIPNKITYLSRFPYCFIILVIMMGVFYILYNKTVFGHNLRSLGNNQEISINVGLDNDKIKFVSFAIGGIFLGMAAVLYVSTSGEVRNVTSLGSMTIMMDSFMGVFLANFLARYCNMTFAVYVGTFTMKLISNGFVAMGVPATVRDIMTGILLFVLLTMSANQGLFEQLRINKEQARIANEEYQKSI